MLVLAFTPFFFHVQELGFEIFKVGFENFIVVLEVSDGVVEFWGFLVGYSRAWSLSNTMIIALCIRNNSAEERKGRTVGSSRCAPVRARLLTAPSMHPTVAQCDH